MLGSCPTALIGVGTEMALRKTVVCVVASFVSRRVGDIAGEATSADDVTEVVGDMAGEDGESGKRVEYRLELACVLLDRVGRFMMSTRAGGYVLLVDGR